MSLARFIRTLVETGQATVSLDLDEGLDPEAAVALVELDRQTRLDMPGRAPELDISAGLWAAARLELACKLCARRDVSIEEIQARFQPPCPSPRGPSTDYSVDLLFQFLPEVIAMARQVSSGDPLLQVLIKLGKEWPLSSVGVAEAVPVDLSTFVDHPCLMQVYVDRILARADVNRLGDRVDQSLREAIGAFPALCPAVAEKLGVGA